MRLYDALGKAVQYAWSGKQDSPLRFVRLLPAQSGDYRPRVYANMGDVGIILTVTDHADLPNIMLDASRLKLALKATKNILQIDKDGTLYGEGQSTIKIPTGDVSRYPAIPESGLSWWTTTDWWCVEQVFHAVSKDKQQPYLQGIHFGNGSVDATDRHRVARAFIKMPWEGVVPIEVFRGWPKNVDRVDLQFTEDIVWFKLSEDEIYLGSLLSVSRYPKVHEVLPSKTEGPACYAQTKELLEAVKSASKISDYAKMLFHPKKDDGFNLKLVGDGFIQEVQAGLFRKPDMKTTVSVTLNLKWILEALRVVKTPSVVVGYLSDLEPIRIESGAFVEGIWPWNG